MTRLLRSDLCRLLRSRAFAATNALFFALGCIYYCLAGVNLSRLGAEDFVPQASEYMFLPVMYIGLALAVFCPFFAGSEYAFGTIKNKLAVGCGRAEIYLSYLILTFTAGLSFWCAQFIAAVLVGYFGTVGPLMFSALTRPLIKLAEAIALTLFWSALSVFITVLVADKAASLVAGISAFAVITAAGVHVYAELSRLSRPDYAGFYPAVKKVYGILGTVIPSAAGLEVISPKSNLLPVHVIAAICLAAAITLLGLLLFSRKNIR